MTGCNTAVKIQPPVNIRIEADTIMFDAVTLAVSYEIEINSVIYNIDENEYTLQESGTYMVRIRSIDGNNNKSNFSSLYTFKYDSEVEEFAPYIIDGDSKDYVSGEDLIINFAYMQGYYIKSITAPNNDIESNEYSIDGNKVTLEASFLTRKFNEDRESLIGTL